MLIQGSQCHSCHIVSGNAYVIGRKRVFRCDKSHRSMISGQRDSIIAVKTDIPPRLNA